MPGNKHISCLQLEGIMKEKEHKGMLQTTTGKAEILR